MAWVESPLQMINALEYAHATGDSLHICLRGGVPKLGDTGRALAPHLPRRVTMSGPWDSALRSPFATAKRRLVGDVCSGQVRAVFAATGVGDLVMVDDGAAMMSTLRRVAHGRPVGRHGRREPWYMQALGVTATSRILAAAQRGTLTLMTAYAAGDDVRLLADKGARVIANEYQWLRTTEFDVGVCDDSHVVVGSALVDDGFVEAGAYAQWLSALAAQQPVAYFPHRRESVESLRQWASIPGLSVRRTGLPIEVALAVAPHVKHVWTLPSSVVATLPRVLDESVELTVTAVPEEWLTPRVDDSLRNVLDTVARRQVSLAAA